MTIHNLVTLSSSTATRLTPRGGHGGMDITIQNTNDSGYVYLGGTSDTTSSDYGFRLIPNQAISFELPGNDALYAISQNNAMTIGILQTGLESQD